MTTTEPPATRLRWPDVAKGACIVLVVLHHVVLKHYLEVMPARLQPVETFWHDLTYALKPIRMPLFFALSGLFAAPALTRPWAASARRIVSSYYLYVVWLAVFAGVYALERDLPANRIEGPADLGGELLWAASSMWFLYALAAYFVLARLTRSWPPGLVVGLAAALSVSVSWLGIEENNRFAVLVHLVYFLAGATYPEVLRRLAGRPLGLRLLLPAYGVLAGIVLYSGLPWSLAAFTASLVGIPLGITLAVRVQTTRLGDGLAWVGSRSLRVYVLHLVVLAAFVQLPVSLGDGPAWAIVAAAYPVVLAILVTGACVAVHAALVRLRCGWLFALPAPLDRALARRAERRWERGPIVAG